MARFCGYVGYAKTVEISPGVWAEQFVERKHKGDVNKNIKRWNHTEYLNDDLTISNTISIIADEFAYSNAYAIRYVKYLGTCWKVESIEIQRPRLILTLGGVYNGTTIETS